MLKIVIPVLKAPTVGEGGYPESFFKELDSGLRPAGMTALTTIFGSMTAKGMKNNFSITF